MKLSENIIPINSLIYNDLENEVLIMFSNFKIQRDLTSSLLIQVASFTMNRYFEFIY